MRRVLITGANRGLGLALTRVHIARGDTVYATCRRPDLADELLALRSYAASLLHLIELDVTRKESVNHAVAYVSERTSALDLVYNNAGINPPEGSDPFHLKSLRKVLKVNVVGSARVTAAFADLLAGGSTPTLINVSSQLGSLIEAERGWGTLAYNTSKAALNMVTRMTASEWRERGIIVLAVHPGWVQTDMGGERASVAPDVAAEGLAALSDRGDLADTGKFFTYEGNEHPW